MTRQLCLQGCGLYHRTLIVSEMPCLRCKFKLVINSYWVGLNSVHGCLFMVSLLCFTKKFRILKNTHPFFLRHIMMMYHFLILNYSESSDPLRIGMDPVEVEHIISTIWIIGLWSVGPTSTNWYSTTASIEVDISFVLSHCVACLDSCLSKGIRRWKCLIMD